jgi:peptide/nickel transport system substrate-binding protein
MARNDPQELLALITGARLGYLSRRQVLKKGLALGLSTPIITALLAACGGDDDDATNTPEGPAAATPTRVPVGIATNTPAAEPTATEGSGSGRNESDNKTFTMLFTGGVPDVDPQSAYDNQASSMFLAAYDMLLRLRGESTFEYDPMLATAWEASDDLTEFTFTIAEGAMFHDGSICDAAAVKASLTRFVEMGRGPVDVLRRFVPDPETQMEAVDATTLTFTMLKPEPLFLAAMASEYGPLIVSPTAMEENATADDPYAHEFFAQNMVGTGPYIVTEAEPQDRFVLDRFPDYYGPPHFFDQIVARVVGEDVTRRQLVETGEADGVAVLPPEDLDQLKDDPAVQVIDYDTTACAWVRLNYALLDVPARQGLCYAFPYTDVIDQVLVGYAKPQGPIADTVVGFDPSIPLYETDLEQAKTLLDSSELVDTSTELEFIMSEGDVTDRQIAELLQANLAEIGYTLTITTVDRSALIDMAYGDAPPEERPHMMASGWWPDYNDSYNQLFPNFAVESQGSNGSNSMFYGNEEVSELLEQAKNAATQEELEDLTGQILQIMMWDDPAAIFYAQDIRSTVLSADIRDFIPNGIYIASYNFHEMWREVT